MLGPAVVFSSDSLWVAGVHLTVFQIPAGSVGPAAVCSPAVRCDRGVVPRQDSGAAFLKKQDYCIWSLQCVCEFTGEVGRGSVQWGGRRVHPG